MIEKTIHKQPMEHYNVYKSPFLELQTPFTKKQGQGLGCRASSSMPVAHTPSNRVISYNRARHCLCHCESGHSLHREAAKMFLLIWIVPLRLIVVFSALVLLAFSSFILAFRQ